MIGMILWRKSRDKNNLKNILSPVNMAEILRRSFEKFLPYSCFSCYNVSIRFLETRAYGQDG